MIGIPAVGSVAWYAVMTRAGAEAPVEQAIERLGQRAWLPRIAVTWRRRGDGRWLRAVRASFPRYLFFAVRASDSLGDVIHKVNAVPQVATVIHIDGRPSEIPQGVIAELMERCDSDGLMVTAPQELAEKGFTGRVGDKVRLTGDLAWCGLVAEIARFDRLDGRGEVGIWLDAFGARRLVYAPLRMVGEIMS